jgi:hypothetical protein
LSFAPGQATATFSIPLNAADSFADAKTATITLGNANGAPLGFSTAALNLTGILPTVPVSITAPVSTPAHKHKKAKGTPTPTTETTSTGTTDNSTTTTTPTPPGSTTTAVPDKGTGVFTVYNANLPPVPTKTSNAPATSSNDSNTPAVSTAASSAPSTGSTATTTPATGNTTAGAPATSNTATSVPASGGTASSTPVASTPGPAVSSVAVQTAHRKITRVIINFDMPLASTGASNLANYGINLQTPGRKLKHGLRAASISTPVGLSSATYDPSANNVTLTLSSPLRTNQMFRLRVNGGSGGITDQAGNALNAPSSGTPGSDFIYDVNHRITG